VAKIEFSAAQAGCTDAKKRNLAFNDRGLYVGSSVQAALGVGLCRYFADLRLDDWAATAVDRLHLRRAQVDARDFVAEMRKAGGGYSSDVA